MPQPSKLGKIEKKKKITDYIANKQDKPEANKTPASSKWSSSALSPVANPQQAKKANMSHTEKIPEVAEVKRDELKGVIGPLITEVTQPLLAEMKLLRESVDIKYCKLEEAISSQCQEVTDAIHRLEASLTKQKDKANAELLHKIN